MSFANSLINTGQMKSGEDDEMFLFDSKPMKSRAGFKDCAPVYKEIAYIPILIAAGAAVLCSFVPKEPFCLIRICVM